MKSCKSSTGCGERDWAAAHVTARACARLPSLALPVSLAWARALLTLALRRSVRRCDLEVVPCSGVPADLGCLVGVR